MLRSWQLAVDIGGTFTDFVLCRADGRIFPGKTLTTPDPTDGVLTGLRELVATHSVRPEDIEVVLHATTLVTNALVERKGAPTGLLTTAGFGDVLEIGRERGFDIYDIGIEMPTPLVPRRLRKEVPERLGPTGEVLVPLDEDATRRAALQLREAGVRAVAVCFLHAYRDPRHELRAAEILADVDPTLAVSTSSEVLPEIREFPRLSTTVANAYVQRITSTYLTRLRQELKDSGVTAPIRVMLSSGGLASVETVARFPIRIVESGPAAGALGVASLGQRSRRRNLVSFDMGGTTAKICLIDGGQIRRTTQFEVARQYWYKRGSGLPVSVPVIDMIEIGAGGGSIAAVNQLGLLSVGPESSGASPGPACYGRGGRHPTVTDADLMLGYLDPAHFLGGALRLDTAGAAAAIREDIAEPLGVTPTDAAWGIHDLVNENMANAAKVHVAERGRSPEGYALVAFGGAGPVHAYGLAEKLGMREVVIPDLAGVGSASGLLFAPIAFDLVRSYMSALGDLDFGLANRLYREMETEGRSLVAESGADLDKLEMIWSCDARYRGQGFEIEVPVPRGTTSSATVSAIVRGFERLYQAQFGHLNTGVAIEILNWRTRVQADRSGQVLGRTPTGPARQKGSRAAYFREVGGTVECPVYDRYSLPAGWTVDGPALIEERETTIVVGPAAKATVDELGSVVLTLDRVDRSLARSSRDVLALLHAVG